MSQFSHTKVGGPVRDVRAQTERVKVLKVVGEGIGQLVLENTIPINAIKIISIDAELKEATDHLFKSKVVKQGIIHKQVLYVDPDGFVRDLQEDIPFLLAVDIPGVERTPFTEIQNHLLDIDVDFILTPADHCEPGKLVQKIVAHILTKVSEWTQIDVVTKVDFFPKVNTLSQINTCCTQKW